MSVNTKVESAPSVGSTTPGARTGPALVALGFAALLAVMDGTVVAVALAPLSAAFGSSLTVLVWVTIGYLLAAASMLPMLGWLTARFGARRVFLAGLGLFVAGSALCAMAWSAGSLVTFRVLQGFGGGLLEPTSLMIAAGLAPKERVGRVLGALSTVINVAPVLGPIVGGSLLDTGHWQWIFAVNLPFGAAVLVAALLLLPRPPAVPVDERPTADVRGLVLLTVGYVAVLFALNRSAQPGDRALVVASAVIGVLLLAAYVWHALTSTRPPALDLRLLRRPGFAATLAVMALVGLIMYSQLAALPIYTGREHSLHGIGAGVLVTALGLGLLVSMTIGGRVSDRTGARPLVRAGAVGTVAGLAIFAATADDLALAPLFALFVAVGLGFGLTAAPTFASVYRTLPPEEQPQGTTALFMAVQFAASLGVTVLSVLQERRPGDWLPVLFTGLAVAAALIAVLARRLPGRP